MAAIKSITVTKTGRAYYAVLDVVLDIEFKSHPEAIINGCHVTVTEKALTVKDANGGIHRYPINIKACNGCADAVSKAAEVVLPR